MELEVKPMSPFEWLLLVSLALFIEKPCTLPMPGLEVWLAVVG